MSEEQRRSWKSDWFGSGMFNWWEGMAGASLYLGIFLAVILAAMLFPFVARIRDARHDRHIRARFSSYAGDLQSYRKHTGHWPDKTNWYKHVHTRHGDSFDRVPSDPWGGKIRYRVQSDNHCIVLESAGRDGEYGERDEIRATVYPNKLVIRRVWVRRQELLPRKQ